MSGAVTGVDEDAVTRIAGAFLQALVSKVPVAAAKDEKDEEGVWVTTARMFELCGAKEGWLFDLAKKFPEVTRVVKMQKWHKKGKRWWHRGLIMRVIEEGRPEELVRRERLAQEDDVLQRMRGRLGHRRVSRAAMPRVLMLK